MTQNMPHIPGGAMDLSHLAQRAQGQQGAGQSGGAPARPGGPAGQAPGAPAANGQVVDVPSLVIDVTDQTFEQAAQLSSIVPVVVDLWADWCQPCKTLGPILEKVTRELAGRVMLAKVDVEANPGLAQAFQAQSIPMVVALVGGRPVPLFQGAIPEEQVREFFARLLQLSEQQGVTGRVNAPDSGDEAESAEPSEPEIPEAHRAAVEAAERGDYAEAEQEWDRVLLQSPADTVAKESRVQVRLLGRLAGFTADDIRHAAAEHPEDLDAQMRVADLDVSGGHIEDAFLRLLDLYPTVDAEHERPRVHARLLELFEVVGVADPRVTAARGRLANLLY